MTKKLFARILLFGGLVLLLALFAWEACAEDLTVVEVRSNIPLSEKDQVFHDYYINSGSNQGLKQHLVVTATRKITVRDATGTQTYGDMMVPVGQLKVIFVGEKFAVAREVKLIGREDEPMIEQTGIMIGDKVDLKASFVDNHKVPSQKSAEKARVNEPKASPIATAKPEPAAPAPTEQKAVEKTTENIPSPEGEVEKTAEAVEDAAI